MAAGIEGAMQQEQHAIVAQRASPLRPTSRLKRDISFSGFSDFSVISVISSFHSIVWRICRISYGVYRMGIYGRQNTVYRNPDFLWLKLTRTSHTQNMDTRAAAHNHSTAVLRYCGSHSTTVLRYCGSHSTTVH